MNIKNIGRISNVLIFLGVILLIWGSIDEVKYIRESINTLFLSGAICFSIGTMVRIIIDLRKDETAKFVRNLFIYLFIIFGFFLLFTGIITKKLYFIPLCALSLATGGLVRRLTNLREEK